MNAWGLYQTKHTTLTAISTVQWSLLLWLFLDFQGEKWIFLLCFFSFDLPHVHKEFLANSLYLYVFERIIDFSKACRDVSMVEILLSMCKAVGPIPRTKTNKLRDFSNRWYQLRKDIREGITVCPSFPDWLLSHPRSTAGVTVWCLKEGCRVQPRECVIQMAWCTGYPARKDCLCWTSGLTSQTSFSRYFWWCWDKALQSSYWVSIRYLLLPDDRVTRKEEDTITKKVY